MSRWRRDCEITTYAAAHYRISRVLPKERCFAEDSTCRGQLEWALRHDADPALIRSEGLKRFFVGENPLDGYEVLCASHHRRHDGNPHPSSLGYRHTPEAKARIGAFWRGKTRSAETRAKMSAAKRARSAAQAAER